MNFVQPLLLFGLLAAAIPVVIHLINRRKAVVRPFPAMEFLLRSQKQLARGLKLKQWILLGLRVAMFLLLPLALALPYAQCDPEVGTVDGRLPSNVVIVIDDSASMERGADGFRPVLDAVESQIDSLRSWDEVAIVLASDQPAIAVGEFTTDHSAAMRRVRERRLSAGGTDWDRAFASARSLHTAGTLPQRRTIFISDRLAPAGFAVEPAWADGLGALTFVDPWDASTANIAVSALAIERPASGDLTQWTVQATLRASGGVGSTRATIRVDGDAVGVSEVELPDGVDVPVTFLHPLPPDGIHVVSVDVDDPRGIVGDNSQATLFGNDRGQRVLVVNGDARAVQYNDEAFFLSSALDAWMPSVSGAGQTVITADSFAAGSLEGMDAVIVANVASLNPAAVSALRRFVDNGGGVLFTVGSNVNADRWNQAFGDLLPKPVRAVTQLCEPEDPDAAIKATRLSAVDMRHPVFRLFRLPGGETLQSVLVYSYALLEPAPVDGANILASYGDGGPALVERRVGQGVSMMLTTSIDLDWSNLPLRTAFVPLTQRLVQYLAGQGTDSRPVVTVGQAITLDVGAQPVDRVAIVSPSGDRFVEVVADSEARFTPVERGLHTVALLPIDDAATEIAWPAANFIAHAPADESLGVATDEDSWEAAEMVAAASQPATEHAGGLSAGQRSLWPVLLFGVLVLLYLESMVAVRRQLWRQLRGR
jgi:hypothetical protein